MFFILFPPESVFHEAGPSVQFSVFVVAMNYPLHIKKELFFLLLTTFLSMNRYLKSSFR